MRFMKILNERAELKDGHYQNSTAIQTGRCKTSMKQISCSKIVLFEKGVWQE